MKKNFYIFLSFIILVLVLDYYTKFFVLTQLLTEKGNMQIYSCLNFIKVWNQGISFGIFSSVNHSDIIFSILSIIIIGWVFLWQASQKRIILSIASGMVIGGALGNILDRIKYGAVFDFIDVFYSDWHYPAFNIADSFICIGVLIILFSTIKFKKKK